MPSQVAFIGLGRLGIYMAANLANSLEKQGNPPLLVWNRSKDKLAGVDSKHVTNVDALPEVASQANIIVTSLANDAAVESVFERLLPTMQEGTLVIETSTVDPELHVRLAKQVEERKASFVASPVFGPPPLAKTAQLVGVFAGAEEARSQAEKVLVPAVARQAIHLGNDVSKATQLKLIGNGMVINVIQICAEALTMGDKTGVGAEQVREVIKLFFNTPSFVGYSEKIMENKFSPPGFTITGGLKDVGHIRKLAASVDCPVPLVDLAHQNLLTARSLVDPESLDWSALAAGQRIKAGLEPFGKNETLKPATAKKQQ